MCKLYDFQALYFAELLGLKLDDILCTWVFLKSWLYFSKIFLVSVYIKAWFFDSVTWSSLQLLCPSYLSLIMLIVAVFFSFSQCTINFTLLATQIHIVWRCCKFLKHFRNAPLKCSWGKVQTDHSFGSMDI
jgi:hypothetical protein